MLNHIVTNSTKNKHVDAIEYKPKFDSKFSLSSGTKYPSPVVNITLRGDKKKRETIIAGLTYLWDSRYTGSMIKRRHTKP